MTRLNMSDFVFKWLDPYTFNRLSNYQCLFKLSARFA